MRERVVDRTRERSAGPAPLRLRPALESDVDSLMRWFADAQACRLWAGPHFRCPFDRRSFFDDLRWSSLASYTMTDRAGTMRGFGQVYPKRQRVHLARLAVDPANRGNGLGQELIRLIITAAREVFPWRESSLFVYRHNAGAYRCYSKAGFVEAAYPLGDPVLPGCAFLVRTGSEPRYGDFEAQARSNG